jgi:DNA-binding transcriptional regulator GbsR (MarR family)
LEEYQYKAVKKDITFAFQNTIQSDIYELLKYNLSLSIDELLEKTSFSYSEISLNVSMMELL